MMQMRINEMLGISIPVMAFSHCRDVVVAVSRAGGLGVLGSAHFSAEQLEIELTEIDKEVGGHPYGVDILLPANSEGDDEGALAKQIPERHIDFVMDVADRLHIPLSRSELAVPLPETTPGDSHRRSMTATRKRSLELLEVCFAHPIKLLASALGPLSEDIVERAHAKEIRVTGLCGNVRHAIRHKESGADFVVAVGTEAAGHTGDISTMVLVPEVVDAVTPLPVVAGGGIGSGRQVAAAMALGAEGVWTGSIWLTTAESNVDPIVQEKLLAAPATATVRSRCQSGKPVRLLRTAWTEAWETPDAPEPLPAPRQGLLVGGAWESIEKHRVEPAMGSPVGQIVGSMTSRRTAASLVWDIAGQCIETLDALRGVYEGLLEPEGAHPGVTSGTGRP